MSAPRVLVSGVVLAQPMGGVVRHNRELLPRVASLLEADGGYMAVMEGREPVPFDLPESVGRLPSKVPATPALARASVEGRALRGHLAHGDFDLVHTGHLPAPRSLPVPYTVTIHDLKSLTVRHEPAVRRLFGRRVIGRAVETAAAVIAVSETLRRELLDRFDVPAARVRVVPNAASHLDPLPRAPRGYLLHVGHLERRKNVEVLLHALAIDPSLPPLHLAGEPKGGERERLRAIASELGVADRITFAGLADDAELRRLYAGADCVVLPSLREGFGIPALEAQRSGAPLAIARIPALLEVAGDGTPSFDPTDAAECSRAIRSALDASPGERDAAAARADRFTWDRSAEAWVDVWRSIGRPTTRDDR